MYGEYMTTRALALALDGQSTEALAIARESITFTRSVDVRVLAAAVEAVALADTPDSRAAVDQLFETATDLQVWDGVVCAVRAFPKLLVSLTDSSYRSPVLEVLKRSNDGALAFAAGLVKRRPPRRHGLLSRREAEVIDLLAQGLRTRAIAKTLYIGESTVKVHVRNILRKLDAHTRAEAVARYAALKPSGEDSESMDVEPRPLRRR
jgi:DNA-binding NarL/FixJ family response regulator